MKLKKKKSDVFPAIEKVRRETEMSGEKLSPSFVERWRMRRGMKSTNKKQSSRSGLEGCLPAYLIPLQTGPAVSQDGFR